MFALIGGPLADRLVDVSGELGRSIDAPPSLRSTVVVEAHRALA